MRTLNVTSPRHGKESHHQFYLHLARYDTYHKSLLVFFMFIVRALVGTAGPGRRRRLSISVTNEEKDAEDEDVLRSDAV